MADRVLVTGGSGFIGSHLVRRLVEAGADVIVAVRPESDLWRIEDLLEWVERTPADRPLPEASVVYHLAAEGVRPDTDVHAVVETNVLGTLRLLEHAQETGVDRFVYCGSCFEYGPGDGLSEDAPLRPITEYGASKAAGSLLTLAYGTAYGLPVVVVRPFTAYGPLEAAYRLVPSVILDVLDGGPVRLTSGIQTRDFVYVADVVDGMLAAGRDERALHGIFNLCTGRATAVRDLAGTISELVGGVDLLPGTVADRAVELAALSGDPARTADRLGWRAQTELADGLRRTLDWFRENRGRHLEYRRKAAAP